MKGYAEEKRMRDMIINNWFKIEDGYFIARSSCKFPVVKIKLDSMDRKLMKELLYKDSSPAIFEAAKKFWTENDIKNILKQRPKSMSSSLIPPANAQKEPAPQSQKSHSLTPESPVEAASPEQLSTHSSLMPSRKRFSENPSEESPKKPKTFTL